MKHKKCIKESQYIKEHLKEFGERQVMNWDTIRCSYCDKKVRGHTKEELEEHHKLFNEIPLGAGLEELFGGGQS